MNLRGWRDDEASVSVAHVTIAIDGPAASGKSTVAKAVARRLGLMIVDSGSMYRAVTLLALERGLGGDADALGAVAKEVSAGYRLEQGDSGSLRVFLGPRDVTREIRSPEVGDAVSPVSEVAAVRVEMVRLQREMVEGKGAVVEGRDIGTTVLPDAELKIFLEAAEEERARRRLEELRLLGMRVEDDLVAGELRRRDAIDSSRELSPLKAAEDAVVIDTTGKPVDEVTDEVLRLAAERGILP
mgnify:CR=1 FL=1